MTLDVYIARWSVNFEEDMSVFAGLAQPRSKELFVSFQVHQTVENCSPFKGDLRLLVTKALLLNFPQLNIAYKYRRQ